MRTGIGGISTSGTGTVPGSNGGEKAAVHGVALHQLVATIADGVLPMDWFNNKLGTLKPNLNLVSIKTCDISNYLSPQVIFSTPPFLPLSLCFLNELGRSYGFQLRGIEFKNTFASLPLLPLKSLTLR